MINQCNLIINSVFLNYYLYLKIKSYFKSKLFFPVSYTRLTLDFIIVYTADGWNVKWPVGRTYWNISFQQPLCLYVSVTKLLDQNRTNSANTVTKSVVGCENSTLSNSDKTKIYTHFNNVLYKHVLHIHRRCYQTMTERCNNDNRFVCLSELCQR